MLKNFLIASLMFVSAAAFAAPKNGEPAPDFSAKGSDGKEYKLSQFKGQTVVLEWFNNDCPYVRKYYDAKEMQKLQKEATGKGIVWLTIASSAPGKEGFVTAEAMKKIQADRGMASTAVLLDSDGTIAKKYEAKTTPHMFVVNKVDKSDKTAKTGKLVYQGAIDDRPSASAKSLVGAQNYVSQALAALEKSETVKTASTTPYGCSVKYQ